MLCCYCCKVSKRDYKVSTTDGNVEMEPLGGSDLDKEADGGKTNGHQAGKLFGII